MICAVMTVVASATPAPVARTVRFSAPRAAAVVALIVITVELPAVPLGANVVVTPATVPSTAKLTLPAKPPLRPIVMVDVPLWPATTGTTVGVAVSEIDGVADEVTENCSVAVCAVTPAPVARMVIGVVATAA